MKSDAELLRAFVETKSEEAFTELVRRHLDFVYSAVLRQVGGDAHLAKDAAQLVFCDLARKARTLLTHETISGWLFRAAHFAAAKIVRSERRRRSHEQEASRMQNVTTAENEPDWNEVRVIIDSVLLELSHSDREAILLRFFRQESFAEIGTKLSLSEDTARKRVARALDKLHALLARRGIISSAAGLAAVLSQNSVRGAPSGLVGVIAQAAINPHPVMAASWSLRQLMKLGGPGRGIVALIFGVAALGTGAIFYHSHAEKNSPRRVAATQSAPDKIELPLPIPLEVPWSRHPVARAENPKSPARQVLTLDAAPEVEMDKHPPSKELTVSSLNEIPDEQPRAVAVAPSSSSREALPEKAAAAVPIVLAGPHVLYVQQLEKWRLVRDVERNEPSVMIDGKSELVISGLRDFGDPATPSLNGNGIRLQPAKHFFPGLIRVENVDAQIISNHINFRASFDAVAPLDHVYLAFEAISRTDHHLFCLEELGKLTPHHLKSVSEKLAFPYYVEAKSYKFYLFTGGVEIMHSEMSFEEIEHGFKDLIALQLDHSTEEKPEALLAVSPDYPAQLLETKTSGRSTVTVRVNREGRVEDPKVSQASDPAFGAAALKAVQQWRFVPAVKNGTPIASTIDLPFNFSP